MRDKFFNRSLCAVLVLSYGFQVSLAGTTAAKAEKTQSSKKWTLTEAYQSKWSKVQERWPKYHRESQVRDYLKSLDAKFNPKFEKQDRDYLVMNMLAMEDFPSIAKAADGGILLTLPSKPTQRLEVNYVGENKFLLNGNSFVYQNEKSLKDNILEMEKVLSWDQVSETSFLNQIFLPQAEALPAWGWGLIAGFAVFVGINLYNNWSQAKDGASQARDGHKKFFKASMGVEDN